MKHIKKLLFSFTCSLGMLCSLVNASANTSWQQAYTDWLLEQTPDGGDAVMLCDMDFDGIPELFLGTTAAFTPIYNAFTYENGKMVPIALQEPGASPFPIATIRELQLYRNRQTGAFLFIAALRPMNDNGRGYSIVTDFSTLIYREHSLTLNPSIYTIKQMPETIITKYVDEEKGWYNEEDSYITYPETNWWFNGVEMGKNEFYQCVNQYYKPYVQLGYPTQSFFGLDFRNGYTNTTRSSDWTAWQPIDRNSRYR